MGTDGATVGVDGALSRQQMGAPSLLAAVLIITFVLHLLVIAEPFGRDQGIFAYIGQTILQGGVPYRDAWDHKTPGIYGVYALAFALFGRGMASVHLFEGIILTLTAFFVYRTGRLLHSDRVGLLGALLYGVSATLLFEWWDRGQAEIYMGLTGTLAVYFLLRATNSLPSPQPSPLQGEGVLPPLPVGERVGVRGDLAFAACGVFCGLTVYFKPTGLPLLAGLGLALALMLWPSGLRRMARAIVILSMGFALSFAPLLAYFAANGALADLYQAVIVFNTYHARIGGNPTLAGNITGTLDFLASMNILAPLALVGLWAGLRPAHRDGLCIDRAGLRPAPTDVILPIWLIASAAGIWTQGKFFSYHWSAVLPPLALLAAWGLAAILAELRQMRGTAGRLVAALICVIVLAIYGAMLLRDHAAKWTRDAGYLIGRTSSATYLAAFGHNIQGRDIYSFSQTQETALYLHAHTSPDDTVLVWGFQALVNFLADRRAPTRYIFTYPLTFDRPESAFRVQARRTFLRDLKDHPPRYIVLVTNDVNPLQAVDSYALLAGFPELQQLIGQQYRLETDIGEFHIYSRIESTGG